MDEKELAELVERLDRVYEYVKTTYRFNRKSITKLGGKKSKENKLLMAPETKRDRIMYNAGQMVMAAVLTGMVGVLTHDLKQKAKRRKGGDKAK